LTNLSEIRKEIDELDDEIINLLNKRLECVVETLGKKDKIEDLNREFQIIQKLKERAGNIEAERYLTEIYKSIFKEGKRIQENIKNEKK